MQVHESGNLAEVYSKLVRQTLETGHLLNPRGRLNRELRQVVIKTTDLTRPMLVCPRINYRFALAELIAFITGWNDLGWFTRFEKNMEQFSDDGKTLNAAYGNRLRYPFDQLKYTVELLRHDPDTRQAVLFIGSSQDMRETRDKACNTTIYAKIRQQQLDLTVFRRSADAIWGVPYDHFVFSGLVHILAGLTDSTPGFLTEFIDSFHVYEPEARFYGRKRVDEALATPIAPQRVDWTYPMDGRCELDTLRTILGSLRRDIESNQSLWEGEDRPGTFWPADATRYLLGNSPCW